MPAGRRRRAVVRALREAGGGAIVNWSSLAGIVGIPNLSPYSAAKGGVIALTRAAAVELAPEGIRVNSICPGLILTPMAERGLVHDPGQETRSVMGAGACRKRSPSWHSS